MIEEWRSVIGWEDWYEVSNLGNVRSVDRYILYSNNQKRLQKGKILKPYLDKNGYAVVCLIKNGKKKIGKIHRLVCQSFLETNKDKTQVNHKNGVKDDNRVENLEWVDGYENQTHAVKTGLRVMPKGEKCKSSKLSNFDVNFIREWIRLGFKQRDIAEAFNVHFATISCINVGKSWKNT